MDDQTSWWQIGLSQTRCSSQKMLSKRTNLREERNGSNHIGLSYISKLSSTHRQSRQCYKKLCSKLASSIPLPHRLYNKCKKWFKRTILASLRHILLNHSNKDQLHQFLFLLPHVFLKLSTLDFIWRVGFVFYSCLQGGRQEMDLTPGTDLVGTEGECGKRVS